MKTNEKIRKITILDRYDTKKTTNMVLTLLASSCKELAKYYCMTFLR